MSKSIVVLLDNEQGRMMAKKVCEEHNIVFDAFEELVQAEVELAGKQKRRGLSDAFNDILDRILQEEEN